MGIQDMLARGLCRTGTSLARPERPEEGTGPGPRRFGFSDLIGRVVELSTDGTAGASLTLAMRLVAEAQGAGETTAWIQTGSSTFFAPDADAAGVDLASLPVVRVRGAQAGGRAADKLLRSSAFGLVVIDLGCGVAAARELTPALQGRLQALVLQHSASLVCLTDKSDGAPSLGPGVSLHAVASRRRDGGVLTCVVRARKDRRHAPGWTWQEVARETPGLR